MRTRCAQGGWVGLIVLLLALVIVGVLSQKLLRQMGLLPDDRVTTKAAGPRGPGPLGAVPIDATSAPPVPAEVMERAKGLESALQKQAEDTGQRIDAQTK